MIKLMNKKRVAALAMSLIFALGWAGAVSGEEEAPKPPKVILLTVGSKSITEDGVPAEIALAPVLREGNAMIALRVAADLFGGTIGWDDKEKAATLTLNDKTSIFKIGQNYMTIDRRAYFFEVPPQIINNLTYIPVKALTYTFGKSVSLNGSVISVVGDAPVVEEVKTDVIGSGLDSKPVVLPPDANAIKASLKAEELNRQQRLAIAKAWVDANNEKVWNIIMQKSITAAEKELALEWFIKLACCDLDLDPSDKNLASINRKALIEDIDKNFKSYENYSLWFPKLVFEKMVDFKRGADVKEDRHTLERLLISSNNLAIDFYPQSYYSYNTNLKKGEIALPSSYPYRRFAQYMYDNDNEKGIVARDNGDYSYGMLTRSVYSQKRYDPSIFNPTSVNIFELDKKLIDLALNKDKDATAGYIKKDPMLNYIIGYDKTEGRYYYKTYSEFLTYAKQMAADNPASRQAIINMVYNAPLYLLFDDAPQYYDLLDEEKKAEDYTTGKLYDGLMKFKPTDQKVDDIYLKVSGYLEKFAE